jgi:hypothetical protein
MMNFLFCKTEGLVTRWYRGRNFNLLDMALGDGISQTSVDTREWRETAV